MTLNAPSLSRVGILAPRRPSPPTSLRGSGSGGSPAPSQQPGRAEGAQRACLWEPRVLVARLRGDRDADDLPACTATLIPCGQVIRGLICSRDRPAWQVLREHGINVVPTPPSAPADTAWPLHLHPRGEGLSRSLTTRPWEAAGVLDLRGAGLGEKQGAPVYTAFRSTQLCNCQLGSQLLSHLGAPLLASPHLTHPEGRSAPESFTNPPRPAPSTLPPFYP